MPLPGKKWWHVIISTYGSWLPGDPRGFRTKNHKVHSSGDYKQPPPDGEHRGLHQYSQKISSDSVVFDEKEKELIAQALMTRLEKKGHRLLIIAVGSTHCHFLAELPEQESEVKAIVGDCKRDSAQVISSRPNGRVWAALGDFNPIENREYQVNVFYYILGQNDAWIWSFRDELNAD